MGTIVQQRFPELINQFFDNWSEQNEGEKKNSHYPDVKIEQSDNGYRLLVPLPGATKDTLKVKVEDGQLKISGEYKDNAKEGYKQVHADFTDHTSFERWLKIEEQKFDINAVEAELQNGILEVTLPLKPEEKKKQYEIEVK